MKSEYRRKVGRLVDELCNIHNKNTECRFLSKEEIEELKDRYTPPLTIEEKRQKKQYYNPVYWKNK